MKQSIIIILLLSAIISSISGQEFNTHWIYAPQADDSSHVYFRRTFLSKNRPKQAVITVTSTGYYKLYVNECNVGTAIFYPYRENGDTSAIENTYDITPYLRSDTNVVAILYSPVTAQKSHCQIAASIYGKAGNDSLFSYSTDESWLCRNANSHITTFGGEFIDGQGHNPSWKSATFYDQALWKNAKKREATDKVRPVVYTTQKALNISHITSFSSEDLALTEDSIPSLYLPYGFYGFFRVTIRGAECGEEISIGDLHYLCNGKTDEQVFPVFSIGYLRTVPITGDDRFKTSHIMSIEAISVAQENQ